MEYASSLEVPLRLTYVEVSRPPEELRFSLDAYELTVHDAEGRPIAARGNYVSRTRSMAREIRCQFRVSSRSCFRPALVSL